MQPTVQHPSAPVDPIHDLEESASIVGGSQRAEDAVGSHTLSLTTVAGSGEADERLNQSGVYVYACCPPSVASRCDRQLSSQISDS
ncbi:hypothetical protein IE81DRAFT_324235 [Ceraceosorus guamensis]|uniref:Uncharacterized protein n=1 Tax=Ceraceosorus guamensis TaxID=1522189 RepID=A0A316VZA5_9BASI|nr:hypothetical protein IE81DRAFT_324235 [Ceraceosorus guamensis]PWN41743.1 hypothetical protein IE81DRAFT_324235 [Ceraceosorus guamensis]